MITNLGVLVVVIVMLLTGHAQDCLTGVKDGPPLPIFPDSFSAEMEANIINLNLTLHMTQYINVVVLRAVQLLEAM